MNILHTEASPGWGGQELRILREAEGMRQRGHRVLLVVQEKGGLVKPAQDAGFHVVEIDFKKSKALKILYQLMRLIRKNRIEIVNTHSSLDAWIGGIAAKLSGCRLIRTRHLSTSIKKGLNSRILYNYLADYVVTTCASIVPVICDQAGLSTRRCLSIPTGIDPAAISFDAKSVEEFRNMHGIKPTDCLAGTLCVLRGWKGISDLLKTAKLLQDIPNLKWIIVGSGVSEGVFRDEWKALGLEEKVIFTGHLYPPYTALAAMDIFLLLSWANEGVSQASLQAALLGKPLITTNIGGLGEVCIHQKTGFIVPSHQPEAVAEAVKHLHKDKRLRKNMGEKAKKLVLEHFTLEHTLNQMEEIYRL